MVIYACISAEEENAFTLAALTGRHAFILLCVTPVPHYCENARLGGSPPGDASS